MSNFTFLSTDWPELYETAREAEQNVNSAPRTSCFYARRSLERAVKWLYSNGSYLKQPYADNLAALIHGLRLLRLRSAQVRSATRPSGRTWTSSLPWTLTPLSHRLHSARMQVQFC
jgi:hypothetical protein